MYGPKYYLISYLSFFSVGRRLKHRKQFVTTKHLSFGCFNNFIRFASTSSFLSV